MKEISKLLNSLNLKLRRHVFVVVLLSVKRLKMASGNVGKLVGQSVQLVNLIGYQDGAVVSRTIIDKKVGTVTLFAFDIGQGLSEHTAPFDALVHIVDGEAEIILEGKAIQVKEGEIVIMPANQPHALKAIKRFKMVLTMIRA